MDSIQNYFGITKSQSSQPKAVPATPIHRTLLKIPQNVPAQNFPNSGKNVPKSFYSGMSGGSRASMSSTDDKSGVKRKLPESVLQVKKLIKEHNGSPGMKWQLVTDKNGESSGSATKNPNKRSAMPSMKIITGSIPQILRIQKENPNELFIYEIHAKLLCVKEGRYFCEKLLLLRHENGPVLQALFYETDRNLPVEEGQLVRCVGSFNHKTRFIVHKISSTDAAFVNLMSRLHAICHFSVSKDKKF